MPRHLQPIFESSYRNIDRSKQLKFKALLMEFQDYFSEDSSDMGLTNLVEHRINTGGSLPIKTPSTHSSNSNEKGSRLN